MSDSNLKLIRPHIRYEAEFIAMTREATALGEYQYTGVMEFILMNGFAGTCNCYRTTSRANNSHPDSCPSRRSG